MKTRIHGIPCQIEVTNYSPAWPGTYWEPPEPEEIEFRVLDRKGHPAPWLEAKLDEDEIIRIEEEWKNWCKDWNDAHLEDLAEARWYGD